MPRMNWPAFAVATLLASCASPPAPPEEAGPYLLFFQPDSAELTDEARVVANRAAADAAALRPSAVAVLGFASPEGPTDANRALARERVRTVERALVAAGVAPETIRPLSLGEAGAKRADQSERYVQILLLR